MISRLDPVSKKYVICADIIFFENTSYFLASMGSITTPLTTPVTFPVPLEDSLSLQVYQQHKKITTASDNLLPYQSVDSTEVFDLFITL